MLLRVLRKAVKWTVNRAGYDIRPLRSKMDGPIAHEQVVPFATYAPWRSDREFLEVFNTIHGSSTLVDIYRCFELWQLVAEAGKLSAGAFLEVGVWRGGTSALLAKRARLLGIRDQVIACDTFQGVVKAGGMDAHYKGGEHSDTSVDLVRQLLERLDCADQVTILQGIFPEETGDRISNQQFRFCHVDVDVYESARDIVEWVWPRLMPGGIIVFDDYGFWVCRGITALVEEYRSCADRLVIHNLNGHALVIKRSQR